MRTVWSVSIYEVAAVIVALVLLGRMAGTHRARAHERGDPAAPGTISQDARRLAANGEEETSRSNPSPWRIGFESDGAKRSRSTPVVSRSIERR